MAIDSVSRDPYFWNIYCLFLFSRGHFARITLAQDILSSNKNCNFEFQSYLLQRVQSLKTKGFCCLNIENVILNLTGYNSEFLVLSTLTYGGPHSLYWHTCKPHHSSPISLIDGFLCVCDIVWGEEGVLICFFFTVMHIQF